MFSFCHRVKNWTFTIVIWAQLQVPLAYATHNTLWLEIDRDLETHLLHLKMYHSSTSTDFDQTSQELLIDHVLIFDHRDLYVHRLDHDFLFQRQSTTDFCVISLSQTLETNLKLIVYQNGQTKLTSLMGSQNDYEIKTLSPLIIVLDPEQSTSVHGLNLIGQHIINQQQLVVTHHLKAIATDPAGQIIHDTQACLFLPPQSEIVADIFLNKGRLRALNETQIIFQVRDMINQGQILHRGFKTTLTLQGFQHFNHQGTIQAQGHIQIQGYSLSNQGVIQSRQKVAIKVNHLLSQSQEVAMIEGHDVTLQSKILHINQGHITAQDQLVFSTLEDSFYQGDGLRGNALTWYGLKDIHLLGTTDLAQDLKLFTLGKLSVSILWQLHMAITYDNYTESC